MDDRGKIHNLGRYRQSKLVDFSGLRWGNITPTDIDGFIDFGDKLFIYIEFKLKGTEIADGQRLAIERLCDRCVNGGVQTFGIIAEHEITNTSQTIDAAKTIVIKYRCDREWHEVKSKYNAKKFIDELRKGRNL